MYALNLNVLCAGAAEGLVHSLEQSFTKATGARLRARYGSVDAMREALLAGEPCDVLIAPAAMLPALTECGELLIDGQMPLGGVRVAIAARDGSDALPDIGSPQALREALLAADALYFADPQRAPAGNHFAAVLQMLGIAETMRARCRVFPNGSVALHELAAAASAQRPLACAQASEIVAAAGVRLVGPLPKEFQLLIPYAAAVTVRSDDPGLAGRFVALLTGADTRRERELAGFEPVP
jgi:molybdate transport system substrate-binding protein